MAENSKLRKAKIVEPPNTLKTKIGSGGIEAILLIRAEKVLKDNTVDFSAHRRRGYCLLILMPRSSARKTARRRIRSLVEAMLYPAAQFKSQDRCSASRWWATSATR